MAEIQGEPPLSVSQPLASHLLTPRHMREVILDHASSSQPSSCPELVGAEVGVRPMFSHSKAYIFHSNTLLTSLKCILFQKVDEANSR